MRLPLEVQAVIFRLDPALEFLILHRTPEKGNFWQNLSGGVEEGESLLNTLERELKEEIGIDKKQIKRIIEDVYFYEWAQEETGQKIKEWVFAVEVYPNTEVRLSEEHDEYRWCDAEEAKVLLKWGDTKIAIDRTIQSLNF